MKQILMAVLTIFSISACQSQIKNAKTVSTKVYGNCEMCQETIEKAGESKNTFKTNWNKDSKMATISFDSTKSNLETVLKNIALAGYDNQSFLAPDDAYAKLPSCCQYERVAKKTTIVNVSPKITDSMPLVKDSAKVVVKENELKPVFEAYFTLKDALVKTDANTANAKAKLLSTAINNVKMEAIPTDVHMTWMNVLSELKNAVSNMTQTSDIEKQRNYFMSVSTAMTSLIKVSKWEQTVYIQHCPMYNNGKGADWLSLENGVKNPYYGNQMLTCGSVTETIKK